jgi:ATP-dependent DNA ligase
MEKLSNNNGEIILQSRNGKLLDVPIIERSLMSILPDGTSVDGEVVAMDGEFQSLDRKGDNLVYQIYDILFKNEKSIIDLSLKDRLVELNKTIIENKHVKISKELNLNTMEEIDAWILETGAEGIVAKDQKSKYKYGDRKCWMKYKLFLECSAQVISYNEGEGRRAGTVGAINVIPEGLQAITKCGSGFNNEQLDEMKLLIDQGKDIIVNVKHFGITNDGCLRFPIFMNIRSVNGSELFR